ncbi:MAG: GNAT family N-acetyltransferase [Flavobacteriales bacterium]|nr:GNAT family N-acetyltransferase [Flavobacteriales bacterium]MCB9192245.1 GNAT family N-acetyltransferase [Flavobacteriales bacterium]
MVDYQLLNTTDFVTTLEKEDIINFLLKNLDDYLDSRDNVSRAIEYALSKFPHQGGFVLMAKSGDDIIGVSVVNRTNFEGYFAENILVYMAVDEQQRRKGIAAELLDRTKVYTKGDVVVRVDGNSAVNGLFKKAGFEEGSSELLFRRN